MAVATQVYLPIKGIEYPLVPEVSQRGKNLYGTARYVQDNGLVVLSSPDVNRVARAVKQDNPSKDFLRYAREGTQLTDGDVTDAYRKLHEDIWKNYWIRAREVLIWLPYKSEFNHPRIVTPNSGSESYIMTDYKVDPKEDKFMGEPVSVSWMRQNGTIIPEMAHLLGAEADTFVYTNPDPNFEEGLRALIWGFRVRVRPGLGSDDEPRYGGSVRGSLLGRNQ